MSTIHSKPQSEKEIREETLLTDLQEPHPDTYFAGQVTTTYEERRTEFIAQIIANPNPKNNHTIWYELIRMIGDNHVNEAIIFNALDFINQRQDCADFVMHSILRLLYQFDPQRKVNSFHARELEIIHPPSQKLLKAAKETILNFKYWPDEPGIDSMCTWTENHYILFSSAAYLAGQLYPDEVFINSGETGREKIARNRPRILRWLNMRFMTGFSEWLSHVYYEEDLGALLSLHDFCDDMNIQQRATMIIDLILLDMVLNQYKGVFCATHGRSYENPKKWAEKEGTTDTMKLLFGRGIFSKFDNMAAPGFTLSNYQIPPVLHEIFQDDRRDLYQSAEGRFSSPGSGKMGLGLRITRRWDDLSYQRRLFTSCYCCDHDQNVRCI